MPEPIYSDFESDWILYYATLDRHVGFKRGRKLYLPSPAAIEDRKQDVVMLRALKFPSHFIASVMQYEMPHIDRVRQMILRHGPEETLRRCLPFLVKNEYTEHEYEF